MGYTEGEMRVKSTTDDMGVRPDLYSSISGNAIKDSLAAENPSHKFISLVCNIHDSADGVGGRELDKDQVEGRIRHTVRPSG